MRVNKTVGNLERVWKQLDESCGSLDNALIALSSMSNLDEGIKKSIERNSHAFGEIVSLKNEVEELIESKKKANMKEEWHFEHDEFECDKCKTGDTTYPLELYLGTVKGKEAMKYVCTNSECDFIEVKSYDEMYEKEYGNKLD